MIEIKGLHKTFGKSCALDGADLDCGRGSVCALMGPNGSGKTTLMKSILGLVLPDSGIIKVNGKEIKGSYEYRHDIGYMPQNVNYPHNLRVSELFEILSELRSAEKDEELIREFRIPGIFGKKFGQLSGGMKQRVSAAIAFLFRPSVLILDEPTSSLDPLSAEIMKEKIRKSRQEGCCIVISSHHVSEVSEMADRLAFMLDGKIVIDRGIAELKNGTGEIRLGKIIAERLNMN
ncbi:MAG: ABC transporter ATP-binding protein [Ignavibacteria bacterium]|nr:ABC transporter ATP-binding protein [Ignavibacteria bacterium]